MGFVNNFLCCDLFRVAAGWGYHTGDNLAGRRGQHNEQRRVNSVYFHFKRANNIWTSLILL